MSTTALTRAQREQRSETVGKIVCGVALLAAGILVMIFHMSLSEWFVDYSAGTMSYEGSRQADIESGGLLAILGGLAIAFCGVLLIAWATLAGEPGDKAAE